MDDTTKDYFEQLIELIADRVAAKLQPASKVDELLTLAEVTARYGMGRGALDARGIPKARYGRSYRWRAADIEAAIRATPPRPRKCTPADEQDPITAMVASGELVARGSRR